LAIESVSVILQDPGDRGAVLGQLASLLADPGVERLRVAVAYANLGGIRALETLLTARDYPIEVEIVVTLDMGITRKDALEYLLRDFDGSVRSITTEGGSGTFHAKVFAVDQGGVVSRALVGSANLTDAALSSDYEAVSVSDLTSEEGEAWQRWWADLVEAADELTEEIVASYEERRPPPGRRERIADEDLETDVDGSVVTRSRWSMRVPRTLL
jgi:phosphatidylserine/phosphatidylglycerophosphate/cardiolipin synthase-like enzyme